MNKTERNLEKLRKIVVKKALEGEKIKEIAHKYMVSRKFVYKWLKRFRENPEGEWWKDRSSRQTTVTKVIKELGLPLWVNRKKRKRPRYKSFERQKPN